MCSSFIHRAIAEIIPERISQKTILQEFCRSVIDLDQRPGRCMLKSRMYPPMSGRVFSAPTGSYQPKFAMLSDATRVLAVHVTAGILPQSHASCFAIGGLILFLELPELLTKIALHLIDGGLGAYNTDLHELAYKCVEHLTTFAAGDEKVSCH